MCASRGRRCLRRTVRRRTTDPITRSVIVSAALAQGGGLADAAAQEVELRAAGNTVANHLDLLHPWRVHHEGPLDPYAAGDATHGNLLVQSTTALAHHRPLEHLDSLAVALDDLDRDAHGVTRGDLRYVGAELLALELLDGIHGEATSLSRPW